MLTANTATDEGVWAKKAEKTQGPFHCPECASPLVLKKGPVVVHHFAHKLGAACSYGQGETELHRKAKEEIYLAGLAHPGVTNCYLERAIGKQRPDVSFELQGIIVAVEVQASRLRPFEIEARTRGYGMAGIAVMWVIPVEHEVFLPGPKFSPKQYEKWLHGLYYGRAHYHLTGDKVTPIHYDAHHLEVRTWYSVDHESEMVGGGQRSIRYRDASLGRGCSLFDDCEASNRAEWQGGGLTYPKTVLWTTSQPKWWKTEKAPTRFPSWRNRR